LQVVEAYSPDAFGVIDGAAAAVFVGGGLSAYLLGASWDRLAAGGRLVANAVTLEGQAALVGFRDAHGGSLTRIAVGRDDKVGSRTALRPMMEVWQLRTEKTET
ncbi:MAG: hypothetical protein OXR84_14705, partial [Magnetovibrio sp.]|nr:hypothetical protein [Magnetovibrio sp.]